MARFCDPLLTLWQRERPTSAPVFDFSTLTPAEQRELDALCLALLARPLDPHGRVDVDALSDAERALLADIAAKTWQGY